MSKVEIEIELSNGAKMGFERGDWQVGRKLDPATALAELDRGYKMIRDWLLSQMPPDLAKPTAAEPPQPERRIRPAVPPPDRGYVL